MKAKRWIVREHDAEGAASLARVLGVSPILAALLIRRGYTDERSARLFLSPTHDQLHWARANGLDVIITDHHLPDEKEGAPPAFAVLNPNQRGCEYPDKNLAGVGVAFKLIHALFREHGREAQVPAFMKVVAIGTVADVAKLVGENRTI